MTHSRREVEIHLPLESLVDTICSLPSEDLVEIKRQIEDRLREPGTRVPISPEDAAFWNSELGREILSEANPSVSLEEALEITSKIKGSLVADITAEREER